LSPAPRPTVLYIYTLDREYTDSRRFNSSLRPHLKLGSHGDNRMDIPEETRKSLAETATAKVRRRDWREIENDYFINNLGFKKLSDKYGASKGTLSYHFNNIPGREKGSKYLIAVS